MNDMTTETVNDPGKDIEIDSTPHEHDWYPLGVIREGKSAAFCESCLMLRWLTPAAWKRYRNPTDKPRHRGP